MSDPIVKGAKRTASRPAPQSASTKSPAKSRKVTTKTAQPKPKRAAAEKAPVRKATPAKSSPSSRTIRPVAKGSAKTAAKPAAKKALAGSKKSAVGLKAAVAKQPPARRAERAKTAAKTQATRKTPSGQKHPPARSQTDKRPAAKAAAATKSPRHAPKPAHASSRHAPKPQPGPRQAPPSPRQPSRDEAAALKAFERAHKEFVRGNFAPARDLFRALIAQHAGVSEVTARARTYLTIAETRLRSESALPRDPDTLYDRGVFEMNRGDFVAAQEMFERALKRDPSAADTHYALAAARARLGAVETAIRSLEQAVGLNPRLRVRAQSDTDLVALRNEPEFERIVFAAPRD